MSVLVKSVSYTRIIRLRGQNKRLRREKSGEGAAQKGKENARKDEVEREAEVEKIDKKHTRNQRNAKDS